MIQNGRTGGWKRAMCLGAIGLAVLPACQRLESRSGTPASTPAAPAALHALQSDRLKAVMAQLNVLGFERLPQEMNGSDGRDTELAKAATTAAALAEAARQLDGAAAGLALGADEQRVFLALAKRLETQASDLSEHARQAELRAARANLREISSTCVACHTLFRSPPPN